MLSNHLVSQSESKVTVVTVLLIIIISPVAIYFSIFMSNYDVTYDKIMM
jgi:hypothetical protein